MSRMFYVSAIIICCIGVGYFKSNQLKKRYRNLCLIKAALCDAKSQIMFFGFDIARVLTAAGKSSKAEPLFSVAAKDIEKKGAAKAWSDALDTCAKDMCLNEEDVHVLVQLSSRLGMTDTKGQKNNIDGVVALLETSIADAKENKDRYCPLCLGGGALVGMFLGLMII